MGLNSRSCHSMRRQFKPSSIRRKPSSYPNAPTIIWQKRTPDIRKRMGGFAALPMQDPEAASLELIRCVKELGFKRALVNGFTQKGTPDSAIYSDSAIYFDVPEYRSFWATVSELDVPFYLHPRMQIPARAQQYEGRPRLMSAP